jgi:hypothetical protein
MANHLAWLRSRAGREVCRGTDLRIAAPTSCATFRARLNGSRALSKQFRDRAGNEQASPATRLVVLTNLQSAARPSESTLRYRQLAQQVARTC